MNLEQLGLKTKPQTKYFDHGHISFKTENKNLFYSVIVWSLDKSIRTKIVDNKEVKDITHLNDILAIFQDVDLELVVCLCQVCTDWYCLQ